MRAAVLWEHNNPLEIEDVQVDTPDSREVLINTKASGVCHSDLHHVEGKMKSSLPLLLGHEGAGIVESVGSDVTYVKPGDRVVACSASFCGACANCLKGRPFSCSSRSDLSRPLGMKPRVSIDGNLVSQLYNMGSFSDQMLVHENAVLRVEEEIPFEVLALLGCGVTTGLGAVLNTAKITAGSTVVVIGCGGVGLSCIQGAILGGAGRIIAIDIIDNKLDWARKIGATDTLNANHTDIVQEVKELTNGGAEFTFEAIGNKITCEQAFEMLAPGGTATIVGDLPDGTILAFDGPSFIKEKKIRGSAMGSTTFRIDLPIYIRLYIQGRLKLDEMVSRKLKLEQINEAFQYMLRGEVARSVIVFD